MNKNQPSSPLAALRHHVTGAINRGEAEAISGRPEARNYDLETILYDLPKGLVDRCDGELYEAVQTAGYGIGVRQLINNWNCWGWTVGRLMDSLLSGAINDDEN